MKTTYHDVRNSSTLIKEAHEWKESAVEFTKASGRLVIATCIEIKNNENVQKAVKTSGKILRKTANDILYKTKKWVNNKCGVEFMDDDSQSDKEE